MDAPPPSDMGRLANADARMRHAFLRDMVLQASIGIYAHEKAARQRVRVNVDLGVTEDERELADKLDRVVDYEKVATSVRQIVETGHVHLVETLAERIAATCLRDERVRVARIRVEKLDVFADTESAGVEIERRALPAARKSSTPFTDL